MRLISLSLIVMGLLVAPASADPVYSLCGTTTVASLVGTTCTIGDKIFEFTSYNTINQDGASARAATLDTNLINFTADASDPFSLSFTLSSPSFSATSSLSDDSRIQAGELFFNVSALPGSLFLSSIDVNLHDASATSDPVIRDNHAPSAFVAGVLSLGSGGNYPDPCEASHLVGSNTDGMVLVDYSCGGLFSGAALPGVAFWQASAGGGAASASMTSVTYAFNQSVATPVPEPSSLLLLNTSAALMGLGALTVRAWRRGRRHFGLA
jgi:hypothetical protein